jgi:leader peptidase (prepilin peptidase)/N-methyltransferase
MIIPNGTVIALVVIGLLYTVARIIFPQAFTIQITWLEALIGFFAASVPLFLVAVLSKGGMGGGDIKLMAAAGIFLGWKGIILAMIVGSVVGAVVSLMLIALKRKKRKDLIPFGPFLCLGILVAAVLGPEIIKWYTGLFTVFQ